jgi:hypothetical protein
MFSTAFFVQALLVSAAFAIPSSKERFASRKARRSAGVTALKHQSKPANLITNPTTKTTTNTTHELLSDNWAGAILIADVATYESVTATFTVPVPESTVEGEEQCASAWVGIDGDTCDTAILQTGIDLCALDGEIGFDAWFEFFPAVSEDFDDITISNGDVITLTATVTSATSGTLEIINESTGVGVLATVSSTASLCQFNAEWIVEDFEECEGSDCFLVPFADFGVVEFTGAQATTISGGIQTAGEAQTIDIVQDVQLTASGVSGTVVVVEYIG